jgi:hypothetical protein
MHCQTQTQYNNKQLYKLVDISIVYDHRQRAPTGTDSRAVQAVQARRLHASA